LLTSDFWYSNKTQKNNTVYDLSMMKHNMYNKYKLDKEMNGKKQMKNCKWKMFNFRKIWNVFIGYYCGEK